MKIGPWQITKAVTAEIIPEKQMVPIETLDAAVKALRNEVIAQQLSSIATRIYPTWHVWKDLEIYRVMDEVSSVVKYLANIAAGIPVFAYDKKTKEIFDEDEPLAMFLSSLTFQQKYVMFFFLYLLDECFIYKETVDFGPNKGVAAIHFLHPQNMTLVLSEGFPTRTLGYIYQDNLQGITLELLPEEVVYIKGFNPSIDYQLQHRGQSPLSLLCQTLVRLRSTKDVSVAQLQNGGTPGILYEKNSNAFDAIEKQGLRETKLKAFLNSPDNKGAPYTMAGDMGWIAMGTPLADLEVAELAKIDKDAIYNAYAVSNRLFNNSDATGSEKSDDNAQKGLYNNACKPKTNLVQDAFTLGIVPAFGVKAVIRFDYSDIDVLQEDMLAKMQAFAAAPTIIPNEQRAAQNLPRIDDPAMDKVYFKSGYVPIEDMIPMDVQPIDNATDL